MDSEEPLERTKEDCKSVENRSYYQRNRERIRARQKLYIKLNGKKINARRREARKHENQLPCVQCRRAPRLHGAYCRGCRSDRANGYGWLRIRTDDISAFRKEREEFARKKALAELKRELRKPLCERKR